MNESNPFAVAAAQSGNISIAQSRAAQEVQASMVIAKKFPRNEEERIERIRRSCSRHSLAEVATYAYPRGGTTVTGASIRLAECLAQNWKNIDFGIVELEQRDGESTVMAFAHDLETNSRQTKIFQVRHERRVGRGDDFRIDKLTDSRDIYEMVANQGARRLRACILGIIPGDVTELALEQCEKTLASGNKEPLIDRVRKMAAAFGEFGVVVAMLEQRLGHKLEATIEQELVGLRKIFVSLKDGMSKREDWFDLNAAPVTRPRFDAQSADTKAESAAGLAPATGQAPASTTTPAPTAAARPAEQPRRGRGRPKAPDAVPAAVMSQSPAPSQAPAPSLSPTGLFSDGTAAKAAEPVKPAAPEPSAPSGLPTESQQLATRVMMALAAEKVTEAETLAILKSRKLCADNIEEIAQLPDETLKSLEQDLPFVAGQARINRRAAQATKK